MTYILGSIVVWSKHAFLSFGSITTIIMYEIDILSRIQVLEIKLMQTQHSIQSLQTMLLEVIGTQSVPFVQTVSPDLKYAKQSGLNRYTKERNVHGGTLLKTSKGTQTKPMVANANIQVDIVDYPQKLCSNDLAFIQESKRTLVKDLTMSYGLFSDIELTSTPKEIALSCLTCDPLCQWHKELMDVIALDLIEQHESSDIDILDDAFKQLFGVHFNSNWLSRFHQSIRKKIKDKGITCFFKNKKRNHHKANSKISTSTEASVDKTVVDCL